MKKKLGKVSQRAIDAFDNAAQDHGYLSDQGSVQQANKAEAKYEKTKAALVNRLLHLEQQIARFRAYYGIKAL